MITKSFSSGARFSWNGGLFEVKRLLPEWQLNIEELTTGAIRIVNRQELLNAWNEGDLRFAIESCSELSPTKEIKFELADYDNELVAKARVRLGVIEPLLELAPSARTAEVIDRRIDEALAEVKTDPIKAKFLPGLSRRTVFRWIRMYTRSGNDLRIFLDNFSRCGGKRKSRLAQDLRNQIDSAINDLYLKAETETIDDVRHEIAVRIEEENHFRDNDKQLKMPARSTIARRIEALDVMTKFKAKHGKRAAENESTQVGQYKRPKMPLERVEIDDTWADIIVLDEEDGLPLGRPNFTYCLDVATGYPLGDYLGFEPPSYYAVLECLYHAISPKPNVRELYETQKEWVTQGIPRNLIIDNGKQYIGRDLEDACASLGITLIYSPVQTPQFKPYVERGFGGYNWLFHKVPGTTFSNIIQKGDYDSLRRSVLTLPELIKAFTHYTVDIYAESFHKGLDGIPARRWEAAIMKEGCPLRLPPSQEDLRVLLGRIEYRTVQRYGIDFLHIRYNGPELSQLRHELKGQKVKFKYHPGDMSRIYVCNPFEQAYHEIPALDQEYTHGLSLWKHRVIRDLAIQEEEKVDMTALGRAKRKIREIFEVARTRKRSSTHKHIARWDRGGQPPSMAGQEVQATNESLPKTDTAQPVPLDIVLDDEVYAASNGWETNTMLK